MSDTFSKIADLIADSHDVPRDNIRNDSHILRDLGLDSIDLYDLTFAVEELFQISIPTEKWVEETDEQTLSDIPTFTMATFCKRIDALISAKPVFA